MLAAAEVIADEGINGLTNAKIAERLAGSTTVVTHYFTSKRELMLHTYQTMAARAAERVEDAIRTSDDALAACLRALLPMDKATVTEWKVWLAFQGMAIGDAELTAIWAARAASAVGRLARLVRAEQAAGNIPAAVNPDDEGRRLVSLVHGMSFQAVIDPAHWSRPTLVRLIDAQLAGLRTAARTKRPVRASPPRSAVEAANQR